MAKKTVPAFSAAALAPAFAFYMRDMHVKYTGPTANIRYGNELAQRCIDYIKQHSKPEHHARLIASEAARIEKVEAHCPAYAEELKQAAFALRLMANVHRSATPD